MDASIDELEIKVQSDSNDAVSGIDRLSASLSKLKGISQGGLGLDKIAGQIEKLNTVLGKINTSKLDGLKQVTSKISAPVVDVAPTITTGSSSLSETSKSLAEITSTATKAKSVLPETSSAIKSVGTSANTSSRHVNKFVAALGRVAMYRFIRSILKDIADGLKTGVNDLYQYSAAMGGTFSKSMDAAASTMLTFKNSLGAMVAPLIQSLVPVLQTVVGWFTALNNTIAQFFAAISGQSSYSKAIAATTQYATVTSKAAGATAALKGELAGFDQLNIIQSSSGGGGGGGVSSKTPNYSQMFEETPISSKMKDFTDFLTGVGDKLKTIYNWLKDIYEKYISPIWKAIKNIWDTVNQKLGLDVDLEGWGEWLAAILLISGAIAGVIALLKAITFVLTVFSPFSRRPRRRPGMSYCNLHHRYAIRRFEGFRPSGLSQL